MRNDAISVVSKLAASPNNVFTRSQAADHGLTRRHLRDAVALGAIQEVHPGVFLGGAAPPTWLQLVAAAGAAAPDAAASHRCAGRLHRLDGQTAPVVELSIGAPRQVRLVDVVGHRGASVRWLAETAERLQRPGQAGPGLVLRLLDRFEKRGVVRDSWFESLIERCLQHPELGDLVIQHRLRDGDGRVVARFDLAVPSAQLGIEGHSRRHHFGADGEASDEHRDNAAGRLGWDVMYIGYGDLRSPAAVLDEVLGRVRARRRQLGLAG